MGCISQWGSTSSRGEPRSLPTTKPVPATVPPNDSTCRQTSQALRTRLEAVRALPPAGAAPCRRSHLAVSTKTASHPRPLCPLKRVGPLHRRRSPGGGERRSSASGVRGDPSITESDADPAGLGGSHAQDKHLRRLVQRKRTDPPTRYRAPVRTLPPVPSACRREASRFGPDPEAVGKRPR